MIKMLLAFLISFILSVTLMPLIIKFFERKKAGQTILNYVENHKDKNGTITMGGVVFILSTLLLAFLFLDYDTEWFIVLVISIFFGVLGFMDDFIKIKYKQNLGLRAYQKIIGQVGLSLIFAIFIYFFSSQKGNIFIPFTTTQIDFGFWIIPLIMLVIIATSNSVNLTDGLDGLAGSVSFVYLIFFTIITLLISNAIYQSGYIGKLTENVQNISVLSMLFAGSILGFLMFNTSKAKIFMGDVGSLMLGGYISASACLIGQQFLIIILGFCFVFSALSVIMQVISFKLTKKRIFKMAPFHHHLQMSGFSEPKIVAIYSATTICLGVLGLIITLCNI